jgi:hypothetical protein
MESCRAEIAARTSELLAERWTPIIIRNLLNGCRTFSEIRKGAPGIPTALLTKRLIIARTDAACLIDIHLKRISYQQALQRGRLSLEGPRQLTEAFMTWVRPSPYADIVPARRC